MGELFWVARWDWKQEEKRGELFEKDGGRPKMIREAQLKKKKKGKIEQGDGRGAGCAVEVLRA